MLVVNKPDNFKPHNSLKISFVNNWELWNFLLNTVLQQQGFIQTLTDLCLLEVKTKSYIEFWNSIF